MPIKENLDQIRKGVEGIVEEGKKGLYRTAAEVERQLDEREGVVGKAADMADTIAERVEQAAGAVADKIGDVDAAVQERGGYVALLNKARERIHTAAMKVVEMSRDAYDAANYTLEKRFDNLEDMFFTDGEYDPRKAREILEQKTDAVKVFGERAIGVLTVLVERGLDDYKSMVPTREEMRTTYAGLGTKCDKIVFRPELDECIAFHQEARSVLPNALKLRREILDDIHSYAVTGSAQLTALYTRNSETEKREVCEKYL